MAPIPTKFVKADPYPKAGAQKASRQIGQSSVKVSNGSHVPKDSFVRGESAGDTSVIQMRKLAEENGRKNRAQGSPTGLPKDWRHTVDSNGTSVYRNVLDESSYRPDLNALGKERNAVTSGPRSAEKKKPPGKNMGAWKPEAPKYKLVPVSKEEKAPSLPAKARAEKKKKQEARSGGSAPNALPKGAGDFKEARANSAAMHQLADQAVEKNGPLSPSALALRTGAVFYDMSGAVPAQKVGEAWGDPNGSTKDRLLSVAELGLALTQYTPVGKAVGEGVQALRSGRSVFRSGKTGLSTVAKGKAPKTPVSGRKVESGGLRGEKPLTEAQKVEMKAFAEELGMPGDKIKFTRGQSGYVEEWDVLMVGSDIMPAAKPSGAGTLQANQRLSWKAAMSHEIDGHRASGIAGKSHAPGSALDEAQASIRAARYGKDLTQVERIQLLRDAISRLHKEGFKIRDVRDLLWIKD